MSRVLLACSLIAALTTSALAQDTVRFAKAPIDDMSIRADVEPIDRAQVRARLLANRTANLGRFRAYVKKGVFPSNTFSDRTLNVWLDADGNLCAAATIINASGLTDLVQRVGAEHNFIRLADVRQGPLMDWILTSGLTQDEIAAIQEPFEPVGLEPEPSEPAPILVDAKLRAAEDARLRKRYRAVEASIVKRQRKSLEQAVDLLMARPALARQLLDS